MRKIVLLVILVLLVLFGLRYCSFKNDNNITLQENSMLIQEQIKNVGKLVVTEGHLSEVYNYENSKEIFGSYFTSDKKALVVVNADVFVSYDLSLLEYDIDKTTKTLTIISIPKEDIQINPDLEYYDIQADYFNPFEAEDYNKIKETIKQSLAEKIETSTLRDNAKNRLLSELSKFYILTNSLGWTLKYDGTQINSVKDLKL